MAQNLSPSMSALGVENSATTGTTSDPERSEHLQALQLTPKKRSPKKSKTPTTPEAAGSSSAKKARRSLQLAKAKKRSLFNSDSEDSDVEDGLDEFEDFRAMRQNSRFIREELLTEDEYEEIMTVEHERVEESGEERVVVANESVNEEDALLRAIEPESVNGDDFFWSDDFSTFSGQEETYLRASGPSIATQDPVEAFLAVWNEEIMKVIEQETNKYAWNKIAPFAERGEAVPEPLCSWTDTSVEELYRYFGVLIFMSVCNRTLASDYWSTDVIGMPDFRRLMSRNRFFLLTRLLRFVDNDACRDQSLSSYTKKIFNIKPILDHCNKQFAALYTPSKHLSLDESLLLWKGRLSWVQSIRTKAARFGIKSYELCEAKTGYLIRCLLYAGKESTMHSEPVHGFENCTAKLVLELMDGFLDAGHTLVMDNWYNQLSLTRYLKGRGTDVIGTLNPRRVHVPKAIKDINPKSMVRGHQIARHCGDISLIAWKDVKLVTIMSTYHTNDQVSASRAGVEISKPAAIETYNTYMGGVDRKDQKLSMFLMERKRGSRWYMKVFKRLLNTSLLNTYIIFRENPMATKSITHRDYRVAVAKGLFERFPNPGKVLSRPNISDPIPGITRRLIKGADHFVAYTELKADKKSRKQKRCVRCAAAGKRTMVTIICTYCDVALCVGLCWAEYHTLLKL